MEPDRARDLLAEERRRVEYSVESGRPIPDERLARFRADRSSRDSC